MEIARLTILDQEKPLGIERKPYFSWVLKSDENNTMQEAYKLTVVSETGEPVMQTELISSSKNAYIPYEGAPLTSRTIYTVELEVQDNHGNTAQAQSTFETALLDPADWKATWVSFPKRRKKNKPGFGKQQSAVMFRQTFELADKPVRARLYATCHGAYELYVNGTIPEERIFAPEHTMYAKYLCYQTYDVTSVLEAGKNVLGMYVGDGWYRCPNAKPNMKNDNKPAILFQLELTYPDGSTELVCSNTSAKVSTGAVVSSDLFAGELYDARLEKDGWATPHYDDSAWEATREESYGFENLHAQEDAPVVRAARIKPASIKLSPCGDTIIDFGQNLAGRVQVSAHLSTGQQLCLEHCEVLDKEGNYFNNILAEGGVGNGCDQKDVFISNGHDEVYEPHFTYHGFRFARLTIDGKSPLAEGFEVDPEDYCATALSSQKKRLDSFETSDEKLNRLYQNIYWSQVSNMLSIPTDCPQREKAGWTGDMLVYSKTALQLENCTPFFTRWLANMECEQDRFGIIPMVVPENGNYPLLGKIMNFGSGCKGKGTSSGWGDAAVAVPYSMYEITGNTAILRKQYYCMRRWVDYVIGRAASKKPKDSKLPAEIENYLWDTDYHYGEWLIPSQSKNGLDSKEIGKTIKLSSCYTAPIFGWYSVSTFAKIAQILRDNSTDNALFATDFDKYQAIADKMKFAIQHGVIDSQGNMPSNLMGAYVLPIYFDLVPDEFKDKFAETLVKSIEDNNYCMDTGFLATPYLLFALNKIGRQDLAYRLLWQTQAPSWLSEVEHGATTIWESTFGYNSEGNPNNISFNHYAFGAVADWIFQNEAGIVPLEPGYRKIRIAPQFDGVLTSCKRTFESAQGTICVEWKLDKGHVSLEVEIPCNTEADIVLPNMETQHVGSGVYQYESSL